MKSTRAERRAARAQVASYHQAELARLLEHVEEAIASLRRGEMDVFAVGDVVHRYERAKRELWKFCWLGHPASAAKVIAELVAERREIDWWSEGSTARERARARRTNRTARRRRTGRTRVEGGVSRASPAGCRQPSGWSGRLFNWSGRRPLTTVADDNAGRNDETR
jgi:hypothetical protein